jgi:hypothetical protein
LEECGPRVTTNGGFKQFAFSSLIWRLHHLTINFQRMLPSLFHDWLWLRFDLDLFDFDLTLTIPLLTLVLWFQGCIILVLNFTGCSKSVPWLTLTYCRLTFDLDLDHTIFFLLFSVDHSFYFWLVIASFDSLSDLLNYVYMYM